MIIGFTAGIGVVIATLQIKDFFGLPISQLDGDYLENLWTILRALPEFSAEETLIAVLTLAVLLIWPRIHSKIPGHLVALTLGTLTAWLLGHFTSDFSVATIGSRFHYELNGLSGSGIPPLLPAFAWPWNLPGGDGEAIGLSFSLIKTLLASAITIAVLGSLESLLCAVVADGMSGKKHHPNDELIGQGLGNIIVPFFGGIPATAAIARTAANIRAGGSSPLSSVVHALFILSLAPLLAYIPMASMAALLIMVAWNMSEARHFVRTLKIAPRDDIITLMSCFLLTVIFDMTIAVAVGMGLAAMLFIRRSISLTESGFIQADDKTQVELPKGIALYDINGPLFFGSTQKAMKNITNITPDIRAVILDMSEVTMIDMSALIAMESIRTTLGTNQVGLIINNLRPRMLLKLRRAGIRTRPGKILFSRSLDEAIEKARRMIEQH